MAKKAMEMTIEIAGKVGSSLGSAFKSAIGSIDDLEHKSRAAKKELAKLGREFSQGKIHQSQYRAETAKINAELKLLEGNQRRINSLKSSFQKGWDKTKAVAGIGAIAAATTVTAATIKSIDVAADFESQMSKVQAKTEATAAEAAAMRETALELGASSSLSASETAIAMDELAAKGFDANKIIGAMPGIIAAAEASGEDLALTSDTVATAINVWSLEATEASRVADVLAMSANVSAAGIDDLAQTFKYAGAPAAALGISLEEVAAAAGIMTDAGLEGGNAGTALRASLLALNNPAKAQEKIMKKLGFTIKDSSGRAKSLSAIVDDLAKSTAHMSEADQVATIAKLVGTEAVSGFLALMKAGPEHIDNMTDALENSAGSAARAAAIMKDNFAGAKEELFGAFESGQIAFATPILDVGKDVFQGITSMIENNMGEIEAAGQGVAKALDDILAPFTVATPVEIDTTHIVNWDSYGAQLKEGMPDPTNVVNWDAYGQELETFEKAEKFKNMDLGDKIVYSLETATQKMEEWLGGSGGEAMGRIFAQLGEIAAKTWIAAFTGAIGGSLNAALEGNVTGALGLGAAAWMLGGGKVVKGAMGAGKWAMEKRGVKKTAIASSAQNTASTLSPDSTKKAKGNPKGAPKAVTQPVEKTSGPKAKATSKPSGPKSTNLMSKVFSTGKDIFAKGGKALSNVGKKGGKALSAVGKVGSKAVLPLGLLAEGFNIFKSKDKAKAGGEAAGGLGGGLGGAKAGAAIGTAIAPGIGTAIGSFLGGAVGYLGGKWAGGKAVDAARGGGTPTAVAAPASAPSLPQPTEPIQLNASTSALTSTVTNINTSLTALSTSTDSIANNMLALDKHTGQASEIFQSFQPLQTNVDLASDNMSNITAYTSQVSGMLYGSLFNLQSNATLASDNMSVLASQIGQASGWISSLQGIQSAGQRVIAALNGLESRINNVQLPGGGASRVSYDG
ncbi:phage-related tail protein [Bacillus sp. OxB-1]|uniref:phage tail tape measure protein n=1 Tax=Bacillus sp. (strain OxB-1) TaxID=98228 RepID=UPI0005822AA2|nr:phage tail tape measure protein [Bacillus sp. OxB-1]BAQ11443.1 phage-related tail protein [Bacillus sp. OxB-1]